MQAIRRPDRVARALGLGLVLLAFPAGATDYRFHSGTLSTSGTLETSRTGTGAGANTISCDGAVVLYVEYITPDTNTARLEQKLPSGTDWRTIDALSAKNASGIWKVTDPFGKFRLFMVSDPNNSWPTSATWACGDRKVTQ